MSERGVCGLISERQPTKEDVVMPIPLLRSALYVPVTALCQLHSFLTSLEGREKCM